MAAVIAAVQQHILPDVERSKTLTATQLRSIDAAVLQLQAARSKLAQQAKQRGRRMDRQDLAQQTGRRRELVEGAPARALRNTRLVEEARGAVRRLGMPEVAAVASGSSAAAVRFREALGAERAKAAAGATAVPIAVRAAPAPAFAARESASYQAAVASRGVTGGGAAAAPLRTRYEAGAGPPGPSGPPPAGAIVRGSLNSSGSSARSEALAAKMAASPSPDADELSLRGVGAATSAYGAAEVTFGSEFDVSAISAFGSPVRSKDEARVAKAALSPGNDSLDRTGPADRTHESPEPGPAPTSKLAASKLTASGVRQSTQSKLSLDLGLLEGASKPAEAAPQNNMSTVDGDEEDSSSEEEMANSPTRKIVHSGKAASVGMFGGGAAATAAPSYRAGSGESRFTARGSRRGGSTRGGGARGHAARGRGRRVSRPISSVQSALDRSEFDDSFQ